MYRLAISPCPNDTFAFYALLHGRTDFDAARLDTVFLDIEALNQLCFREQVDFCKISFGAYAALADRYRLLEAGSALGFGCGPLLVARAPMTPERLARATIAVPGRHTTAALLLRLLLGELATTEMAFDRIMPAVAAGDVDAGLIIHESRFTYRQHGLVALADLGERWERETGHPIPLGGIVAHRRLDAAVIAAFDHALAASVAFAREQPGQTVAFMRRHAQEMDQAVMEEHVKLYVNDFTQSLGARGHAAVAHLLARAGPSPGITKI